MTYEKMMRFTYNDGAGDTFTTVANFASHTEQDLELQIRNHMGHYGVIHAQHIEPQDLEFEDLAED